MEEPGPEAVTDQENGRGARRSVFGGDGAAEDGRYAENSRIGSDRAAREFVRAIAVGEADLSVDETEHIVEGMLLLLEIGESCSGKAPGTELIGGKNREARQALCVLVGIRRE